MNLFTKQKLTHRHKFIVTKRDHGRWWEREKLGVCDQQIQTIIYKIDKQRPTVLNQTQNLRLTYNGKESEKEYTYIYKYFVCVCVLLNHFAIPLKLIKHCKETILHVFF